MTSSDKDQAAVLAALGALVDAWARHDADAYGALFTADASYTTYVGTRYQGRDEIAGSHRTLWGRFLKGTRLADEVREVRQYGTDTIVVTTLGDTYQGSERPARLGKVQTYTVVREADGQWRIAAFHNTKRRPVLEAISFRLAPDLVPAADR